MPPYPDRPLETRTPARTGWAKLRPRVVRLAGEGEQFPVPIQAHPHHPRIDRRGIIRADIAVWIGHQRRQAFAIHRGDGGFRGQPLIPGLGPFRFLRYRTRSVRCSSHSAESCGLRAKPKAAATSRDLCARTSGGESSGAWNRARVLYVMAGAANSEAATRTMHGMEYRSGIPAVCPCAATISGRGRLSGGQRRRQRVAAR